MSERASTKGRDHELAPASVPACAWQDISTAPKDGTDIILGAPEQTYNGQPVAARSTIGHWTTEEECREQIGDCGGECRCPEYAYHDPYWMTWDGGFTEENPPTHWMPLPPPPVGSGRNRADATPNPLSEGRERS